MTEKVYYIKNTNKANETIDKIVNDLMCFVRVETIEMDYLELTVKCRNEDIKTVEKMIDDLFEE